MDILIELPMTSNSIYPELFINSSLFSSIELTDFNVYKIDVEGVLISVERWKSIFGHNGETVYLPKLNRIVNHSGLFRDGRATRAIDALVRATDEPLWFTTIQTVSGAPFFSSLNKSDNLRASFYQSKDLQEFGYFRG